MSIFRRGLSLFLAVTFLITACPVSVFATMTEESMQEQSSAEEMVEEITSETEESIVPTEAVTVSTEVVTVPTEVATVSTEPAMELLVETSVESVASVGAVDASAVASGTCGENLTWVLDNEGDLTISGTGTMEDYEFQSPWPDPAAVKSAVISSGVTTIGNYAFYQCENLTKIIIPETVTEIGDMAFCYCRSLTEVNIPDSVTSIGTSAFFDCVSLPSLSIPDSVESIGNNAFYNCAAFTEIDVPKKLTEINYGVYRNCTGLTEVIIPDNITVIGQSSFSYCSNLTAITISKSVTQIGMTAFVGCSSLKNVYYAGSQRDWDAVTIGYTNDCLLNATIHFGVVEEPDYTCGENLTWHLDDGVLTISGTGAMRNYAEGESLLYDSDVVKSVIIAEGATTIGSYAFSGFRNLEEITLPKSISSIGMSAFISCSNLQDVYYASSQKDWKSVIVDNTNGWLLNATIHYGELDEPNDEPNPDDTPEQDTDDEKLTWNLDEEGVLTISGAGKMQNYAEGESPWCGSDAIKSVIIMDGATTVGNYAFSGCHNLVNVTLPESITVIGMAAFMECSSLTGITVSEGATYIDDYAFKGCSSLISITIPESVTWIGSNAFESCCSLTNVMIPEGLENIFYGTFRGCSSLTSIVIPESVTYIGDYAFSGCSSMTSITIPESVTSIGSSAFSGCSSLNSMAIPERVTSISSYAFQGCSSLISITIPENVKHIYHDAFQGCSSLTSITIPESITDIDDCIFSDCKSLTNINIPENITTIGSAAFSGCSSLTSINIPENVTSIGRFTFSDCSSLISINIPESVTSIGSAAFSGCSSLTSISIPESVTSIDSCVFKDCTSLNSITLPQSLTKIGDSALEGCSSLTEITLPQNLKSIGNYAFEETSITVMELCDSITSIGMNALPAKLTYIRWTKGIPIIPYSQFSGFTVLETVILPEGITELEDAVMHGCFEGCSSLTSITLPQSLTKIGNSAFYNCSSLTEITLSENLESIGLNAFYGCCALTEITLPKKLKSIGAGAFKEVGLTVLELPDGLENIGDHALSGTKITRLRLPNSVTSIGADALPEQLTYIQWTKGIPVIPDSQFSDLAALETVILPEGITSIGCAAFANCSSLTGITIPESMTSIGSYAFANCSSLTGITIPESTTSINDSTFKGCSSLMSISIPEGVTSVGDYAFEGCSSLTELEFPNSLENVGYEALSGTGITRLELPDSVTSIAMSGLSEKLTYIRWTAGISEIPSSCFETFSALETVILPEGVTFIDHSAFFDCKSLTSITIPESIREIEVCAFYGCSSLKDVYYASSEEAWNKIIIVQGNNRLTDATIHFNSASPDGTTQSGRSIRFFSKWDADIQQAFFGTGMLPLVLDVNEATDTSFIENIDNYVGKYVLVEADIPEGQVFSGTLISMKALDSAIGTVSAVTLKDDGVTMASITVDGKTYPCAESASPLLMELPVKVRYHILDGTVVDTRVLTQESGTFEAWDEQSQQATISGIVLSTNYLTDLSFLEQGEDLVDMRVVYDTDGDTLFSLTGIPKTYQLKVYSEEPTMITSMNTSFDICVALCLYDTPVAEWEKPAMVIGNTDVISVTDVAVEDGFYRFTINGLAEGSSSLTITDAETGAYVIFSVGVSPAAANMAVYRMGEIPEFYPTWDQFSSHIKTNFYNINGLVVNNMSKPRPIKDGYEIDFIVYNTRSHYGAVDVYDKDNHWIKSYKIDKKRVNPESAFEAFEDLFYLAEGLSYESSFSSVDTPLTVSVPEGGYFVISNNWNKSPGTALYNNMESLIYAATTGVDLIGMGIDASKATEEVCNAILSKKEVLDAFYTMFMDGLLDIGYNSSEMAVTELAANVVHASAVNMEEVLDAISDGLIDWRDIVSKTLDLPLDALSKVGGSAGVALDVMFKITKALNMACMFVSMASSENAVQAKVLTPVSMDDPIQVGITVTPSAPDTIPEEAVLNAFCVAKQDDESIVTSQGAQYTEYETYNICFVKDDKEVSINGKVTVSIPIPEGYNGEKCIILRQESDGTWTQLPSRTEGNFLIFETNHFSLYAVVDLSKISLEAILISQEYIALRTGQSHQLTAKVQPAELAELVQWSMEDGDESIASVDENGLLRANNSGTAYAIATVTDGYITLTARCRVDVTEPIQIDGIQLSTNRLPAELFSTDYASFEILLELSQNYPQETNTYSLRNRNNGVALESVRFTDKTMAELFELIILDDRRVLVIPTETAIEKGQANAIQSSYVSTVSVKLAGLTEPFESDEKLTLTVKKTTPKLTAKVPTFNSFYTGQTQEIQFSGGTVTNVALAEPHNWLTLEDGYLKLTENAPAKSASTTVNLLVDTEEWVIPAPVKLSVTNTYKQPGLKLSASSVTLAAQADASRGAALQLRCTSSKDTLSALNVADLTVSEDSGYAVENFSLEDGSFTLKGLEGFRAGTVDLLVSFSDTDSIVKLPVTVKTEAVMLKLSTRNVSLNRSVKDSAVITVTATPSDYLLDLDADNIRLADTRGNTLVDPGILDITADGDQITITTNDNTPAKGTYRLYVSAGDSKAVYATITVVSKTPSVSFKAKGSLDLSFPDNAVTIIPSFRNCTGNGFALGAWTVTEKKSGKVLSADAAQYFDLQKEGSDLLLTWKEGIQSGNTYEVKLTLELPDGTEVTNKVSTTAKRTNVRLKLEKTSVSLNKLLGDTADVTVSCSTAGYAFEGPMMELRDSTGRKVLDSGMELTSNGKLHVTWADGKLHIEPGENAEYGKSYQIRLKANDYSSTVTLKVSILSQSRSKVSLSLKAKGSVDVIRQGSAVTVTPIYKNCTSGKDWQEALLVYTSADKYKTAVPADELFHIEQENGVYILTQAGDLNPNLKYKVQLVSRLGDTEVRSSQTSISVKMGSAKVTMTARGTTLFAKDRNDCAELIFTAKDETLNQVKKIEIRESKYRSVFEIIEYGNGEFAIGFKDGKVDNSIRGKTITLNLNIYLEGNETGKVNTSVKLKLTIIK